MQQPHNDGLTWQLSTHTDTGACVEVARPTGAVLVRDSKRRAGPRIRLQPAAFSALIDWTRHQA
ncbi:DUF397 domain-containing protein [Streptomyces sp. NPDC091212]|uniref:DUF397 domain-containing protein n=1 Tax=Streptomyces sp. NPDC091212 TaxID=3155191 RepID=UPI0034330E98